MHYDLRDIRPDKGKIAMFLAGLLLTLSVAEGRPADQDMSYYLDGRGFNCLLRDIERISRRGARRLTIDLRTCPPRPQVSERLSSWPSFRQSQTSPTAIDTVIVLTREDIACIRANRHRTSRLREAAGKDRYRLKLSICAR